jgi:hypothetical protein
MNDTVAQVCIDLRRIAREEEREGKPDRAKKILHGVRLIELYYAEEIAPPPIGDARDR